MKQVWKEIDMEVETGGKVQLWQNLLFYIRFLQKKGKIKQQFSFGKPELGEFAAKGWCNKVCKVIEVEIIGYGWKIYGISEIRWMHMDGSGFNSVQHSSTSVLDALNTGPGSDLVFL